DAYNHLAKRAGATPDRRMTLFTTAADEFAADGVWRQARFGGRPVVCLNPGAAFGSSKYWSAAAFAEVGRRFAARGCGVLAPCGPSERDLAREIVALSASSDV